MIEIPPDWKKVLVRYSDRWAVFADWLEEHGDTQTHFGWRELHRLGIAPSADVGGGYYWGGIGSEDIKRFERYPTLHQVLLLVNLPWFKLLKKGTNNDLNGIPDTDNVWRVTFGLKIRRYRTKWDALCDAAGSFWNWKDGYAAGRAGKVL